MATTNKCGTVRTKVESTAEGYRVVYTTPPGGFSADQHDALQLAITLAYRHLAKLDRPIAPPRDLANPFALQHDRLAAPC